MTGHGRKRALWALIFGGTLLSGAALPGSGAVSTGPVAFQEAKKAGKPPALSEKHKKWLDEEVPYIISENEKAVFRSLRNDGERENFIKMFWKRRDPTPETPLNEFREEHYRRISFANDAYFEGKAGWRSDRGRVYIMFGPPDFFETNPGGGRGFLLGTNAPSAEFPSEVWTYREIPGLKLQEGRVDFTFVNYYAAGSYQLTDNPALANALRNISVPARYAGYNDMPSDSNYLSPSEIAARAQNTYKQPLQQLQLMAELTKSRGEVMEELERSSRQRKLKGIVESKASVSALTIVSKQCFLGGAEGLTYVPMVLEVPAKDLEFRPEKDRYQGLLNFYIEVKDADGPVFQKSDRLEMNLKEDSYRRRLAEHYQYLQGATLKSGRYFLHLVVWDEISGKVGYLDKWIERPGHVLRRIRRERDHSRPRDPEDGREARGCHGRHPGPPGHENPPDDRPQGPREDEHALPGRPFRLRRPGRQPGRDGHLLRRRRSVVFLSDLQRDLRRGPRRRPDPYRRTDPEGRRCSRRSRRFGRFPGSDR